MRKISARIATVVTALATGILLTASPAFAHSDAPAGGVPTEDLIPAAIVGAIIVAAVAVFGWLHRTGKTAALTRLAAFSGRVTGQPGWVALPAALVGGSLLIAVFGFYWDVATHIDNGRDPGPFANPSHWFIIFGLLGIALAGVAALLLGVDDDAPTGVRLREGWRVPIGGVLLTICGVIALLGFPLDDVWHRIFGQDVTLWSPTHIQMVGGASLSTLCLWILVVEGRRAQGQDRDLEKAPRLLDAVLAGAFLVGASTLQAEFDYAVPQFRLLYHPVLIMAAAGIALVPARLRLGRGGALKAVAVFLVIRGLLTLLVTPMMGRTLLHFPLYLAAAVAVELVGRRVSEERQITFGAWAGVGIGTLGLAGEWVWTHVGMPIPWPVGMIDETLLVAVPTAIAAGLVGGFISRALVHPGEPRQSVAGWVPAAAGVVLVGALVYPIPMADLPGSEAHVTLQEVDSDLDERTVEATIRLSPADIADGSDYVNVTAWQGAEWRHGVHSFADPLERVEQGVYRTTRPIPVEGQWKALIRLHNGRVMISAPIFMPEDQAIDAEEVPAEPEFTREFVLGEELLLREAQDAPGWITLLAYVLAFAIIVVWVASVGWGVRHLRRVATRPAQASQPTEEPAHAGARR
jgi:hypothetical protein